MLVRTNSKPRVSKFSIMTMIIMIFLSIAAIAKANAATGECTSCDQIFTGSETVNLFPGNTLCIKSGNFSQAVLSNDQNRQLSDITICVAEGATYEFSSNHRLFSFENSKIVNRGSLVINGANLDKRGFIDNYGTVIVQGNLNMNNSLEVKNYGSWVDQTNFVLKNESLFINEGSVFVRSDFNSGSNTTFVNNGRVEIGNNFNPGGEFYNNGPLVVRNFSQPNSGSKFINQCFFYSEQGFNNNFQKTENYGLIQVGPGKKIQLNNDFFQGPNGTVRGTDFINSGRVTGNGFYHFTGDTRNQGQFGTPSGVIHFYDQTPHSPVFDYGNPGFVTSTDSFIPMDTIAVRETICPGVSVLPVELVSFRAAQEGYVININWVTASEFNSDYFVLERSYDGLNFTELERITGSGTTSYIHEYEYIDNESSYILESVVYYRLKQVDYDGGFEIFKTITVNLSEVNNTLDKNYQIFPNPTRDFIRVQGTGNSIKELFSMDGKLVLVTRELLIDMGNLVSGIYFLKIGENIEKVIKI